MYKREIKQVEQEEVVDVMCDVCGESTMKEFAHEFAKLEVTWGFGSDGRDGEQHEIHFCQKCYEDMLIKMGIDVNKIAKEYQGGIKQLNGQVL